MMMKGKTLFLFLVSAAFYSALQAGFFRQAVVISTGGCNIVEPYSVRIYPYEPVCAKIKSFFCSRPECEIECNRRRDRLEVLFFPPDECENLRDFINGLTVEIENVCPSGKYIDPINSKYKVRNDTIWSTYYELSVYLVENRNQHETSNTSSDDNSDDDELEKKCLEVERKT